MTRTSAAKPSSDKDIACRNFMLLTKPVDALENTREGSFIM
ncbi:hypothetical protein [Psychrobacter piscatorii]|nr:hypothetical protein [Psychrobacter piscatorii]